MKVERNSYALSLKKWKFDVKNCEVEVIILVKRNAAFHDFYSERHSNLCGKLVNFRTLCNCYIIPKFSQNWQKLKAKIAKLHHKIANCRKDFLHQTSSKISKNHAMIYVEDLQVSNMSKSAKGTEEEHGKNVKQKSGLNRAILDQSWAEFRRQLDYKTQWLGGFLVAVPPQNTSRTCPCCGYTAKENRQTQADFKCVECGYTENADLVGALNILERGRAIVQA